MKIVRFAAAAAAIILLSAGQSDDAKLQVIRYDALTASVKKLTGKVIVVDFWGDFCVPCKREFPNLVALERKYRSQGCCAVSVALDENTPEHREAVSQFLRRQHADFANYLLDERASVWQAKLKIDGPPLVYVFDRRGKLARRFTDEQVDYKEIEALVVSLLRE